MHTARALAAASGAIVTRVDPNPGGLLQTLANVELQVTAALEKAREDGDGALVLKAAAERRRQIEFLAKLSGELSNSGMGRADLRRITSEMAGIVEAVVRDPEQLAQIQEGWRSVRIY